MCVCPPVKCPPPPPPRLTRFIIGLKKNTDSSVLVLGGRRRAGLSGGRGYGAMLTYIQPSRNRTLARGASKLERAAERTTIDPTIYISII